MRAPLSIVIPTLNAGAGLGDCLAALIEGLSAGMIREVVVSDGGSTDGTLQVAREAGAVAVSGPPGRGGQLGRGAEVAGGEWLLFLHGDTVLGPGWADEVARVMSADSGRAYYGRLQFDAKGMAPGFVAGWANLRSRVLALPYGDQGLLMSRALYDAVGGFDDIPLMEDVAMARALGRSRMGSMAVTARTSAARYVSEGWTRRGGRNLWTLLRYLGGAAPERLVQDYRRSGRRS